MKRQGSILMLAIIYLFLLQILAVAFVRILPVESRAALRSEESVTASLVAEAGVTEALAWLRAQLEPPDGSASREPLHAAVYPSQTRRTVALNSEWSYRWSLSADAETYPNGSVPIRGYTIVARAYHQRAVCREARAQVIQEALTKYAALYDQWPDNLVMGIESTDAPQGGPVHVNDVTRLWIKDGASYWTSSGQPFFSHGLTASGVYSAVGPGQDGFAYYQGNWSGNDSARIPYSPYGGPIASRYNRLVAGGRDNIVAGVQKVKLPENTFSLRDAAWGFSSTASRPSTDGLYLNSSGGKLLGGIYIRGTVEEMQLGFGGSQTAGSSTVSYATNSWVKVEQYRTGVRSIDSNQCYTVVTVEDSSVVLPASATVNGTKLKAPLTVPVGNTILRQPDGTFMTYQGLSNGVVYATNDVDNLWGTNKGRRTIVSEQNKSTSSFGTIRIGGWENDSSGNVSKTAGQKGLLAYGASDANHDGVLDSPATAANALGLVAYDVTVSSALKGSSWSSSHPSNNPLYLYCSVVAGMSGRGGSYAVESYTSGGAGYAYRYGSRIQVDAGAWGTTSGQGLIMGTSYFDEASAASPPPYFPALPTFSVVTYEDTPVFDGDHL